jgi:16S rRNA (adenine1518-N6/adenine1519-N6)-dimethyltransferase
LKVEHFRRSYPGGRETRTIRALACRFQRPAEGQDMDGYPAGSRMDPSWVHRKRFLEGLFRARRARPRRDLGQNFILDPSLLEFIVASAEIGKDDAVLEVGTGTGQMTSRMAAQARAVVGVEIDRPLFDTASKALAGHTNVRLLLADALAGKSRLAPEVVSAAREAAAGGGSLLHVSNLAYRIATPLILTLLESDLPFRRMVVTVPLELAEKLAAARPGDRGYGGVSVLTSFHARGAILRKVAPDVFWPKPNVISAILRLDVLPVPERPPADYPRLRALVRGVFTQRRKTLARSLESLGFCGKGEAAPLLAKLELAPKARPEELTPGDFVRLAAALPEE